MVHGPKKTITQGGLTSGQTIILTQNSATTNVQITQNAQGAALRISQNANANAVDITKASGDQPAMTVTHNGGANAIYGVQSGSGSANGAAFRGDVQANATNGNCALFIQQATGNTNTAVYIENSSTASCKSLDVIHSGTGSAINITDNGNATALSITKTNTGNANIMQIANSGTGKDISGTSSTWYLEPNGVLKVGTFTTAGRPAASTAGRVAFDTTLGKLIVDNGTTWEVVTSA